MTTPIIKNFGTTSIIKEFILNALISSFIVETRKKQNNTKFLVLFSK